MEVPLKQSKYSLLLNIKYKPIQAEYKLVYVLVLNMAVNYKITAAFSSLMLLLGKSRMT